MELQTSQFLSLTQGLPTKSEKIRTLARHGAKTADIARFLEIKYTHARNVLKDAGLHPVNRQQNTQAQPIKDTPISTTSLWVEIDPQGRVQLPEHMLETLGMRDGSRVMIRLKEDRLEIVSQKTAWSDIHKLIREKVPEGVSLVDELIAERRREAQRELEEAGLA
jgi:bifunctional DNA-binding transcriptional regulator/antitoxin component of YhaV-PrlF toxin-antitoxin module